MIGWDPTEATARIEQRQLEVEGPVQFLKRLWRQWRG